MHLARIAFLVALSMGAWKSGASPSPVASDDRVFTDAKGRIVVRPLPVEDAFRNPWPASWEDAFWDRINASLKATGNVSGRYGTTFFESEKSSYPNAFIDFLQGNRAPALAFLQADDNEPWSQLTLKVDWFPSFTLKSQTRKYFFFGQYLDPAYRQRMFDSAKIWTEQDPLRRPNPFWLTPAQRQAKGMTGEGWTPQFHNSWVDVRNTDNLRAMREGAVYLMAEETGNMEVAQLYRRRIRAYVTALYHTGMGEWDSANYFGHALTGHLQLYDFARDPETRLLAKATLDWLCAAAAVKYFRGSWGGPNIRDYGNIGPHAGAAGEFWHYFGELPQPANKPYRDFVHVMTSAYRPPTAVVELARKHFSKPVEILASKPSYDGWSKAGGETEPAHFETTFIGHHCQLGSLPNGHLDPPGMNLNGFRLLAQNSRRGADTLIVFTSLNYSKSPASATAGGDQLAQYRGNLLWLNANPETSFYLLCPRSAEIVADGSRVCFRLEQTWLALHLIGATAAGLDAAATAQVCGPSPKNREAHFPEDHVWSARGDGTGPCGFALEIGEPETDADFATFRAAVNSRSKVDLSKRGTGEVHFTSARGEAVGLRLATSGRPTIFRNGALHDWTRHWALWGDNTNGPIALGWKEGTLSVRAGGQAFQGRLQDGHYSFENRAN